MATQTDNSYLEEKVQLRLDTINMIDKDVISVLECYAGDGYIWSEVRLRTKKEIKVLRIDQKPDKKGVYLKESNMKFIKSMDFSQFDIVDLDAYGIPFEQLEVVFEKKFKGCVHVTAIQSVMVALPDVLLEANGIPARMYKKTPILFSKHGLHKLCNYLQQHGVEKITGFFIEKKNYFYFFLG